MYNICKTTYTCILYILRSTQSSGPGRLNLTWKRLAPTAHERGRAACLMRALCLAGYPMAG